MPDYGLGLGGTAPQTPSSVPGGMGSTPGGMGQTPDQTAPELGLGTTAPSLGTAAAPAPNGGASGGAGGGDQGGFTPGQGLNWQGASPSDLYTQFQGLDPTLQQSYVSYYMNNLDPTQQAAWRNAFGQNQPALSAANPGMGGALPSKSYPGAIADPSMGIHGQQPTQPGLGGAPVPPTTQEGPPPLGLGGPPDQSRPGEVPPVPDPLPFPHVAQIGNYNNAPGGPGSLQQGDPGDYWRAHQNDAFAAGANQGPDSPGGGGRGDPWTQPAFTQGGQLATQGYAMGAPSTVPAGQWGAGTSNAQLTKWDQPGGPAPSMTMAGQQELSQPLSANGQQFQGLPDFIKYMMTSTPGEQQMKQRLSGMDAQGDTLQPGEQTLFDAFAPYLTKDSTQPQPGATPFTNWDPVGLLHLLMKSGILNKGA